MSPILTLLIGFAILVGGVGSVALLAIQLHKRSNRKTSATGFGHD